MSLPGAAWRRDGPRAPNRPRCPVVHCLVAGWMMASGGDPLQRDLCRAHCRPVLPCFSWALMWRRTVCWTVLWATQKSIGWHTPDPGVHPATHYLHGFFWVEPCHLDCPKFPTHTALHGQSVGSMCLTKTLNSPLIQFGELFLCVPVVYIIILTVLKFTSPFLKKNNIVV